MTRKQLLSLSLVFTIFLLACSLTSTPLESTATEIPEINSAPVRITDTPVVEEPTQTATPANTSKQDVTKLDCGTILVDFEGNDQLEPSGGVCEEMQSGLEFNDRSVVIIVAWSSNGQAIACMMLDNVTWSEDNSREVVNADQLEPDCYYDSDSTLVVETAKYGKVTMVVYIVTNVKGVLETQTPPAFALKNIEGEEYSYTGSEDQIFFNMWATWCPYCVREMAGILEVAKRHPDTMFYFINEDDSPDDVRKFIAENGFEDIPNVEYLVDDQGVLEEYGVWNLPSSFIIHNGAITKRVTGEIDVVYPEWEELLN